ncbi:hypothetical protein [Azospirillum brasilense]|nr:hypothetical protein [Azospirillum brasilense]
MQFGFGHQARSESANEDLLRHAVNNLDGFLNREFDSIVKSNFAYLRYFFEETKKSPNLRLGIMAPTDSVGLGLIDLYRDPPFPNSYIIRRISDYSPFSEVNQTGSYFLCNDIPNAVKAGKYFNHRIDQTRATTASLSNEPSEADSEWCSLWSHIGNTTNASKEELRRTCYKSNLIIPITLANNHLSIEFQGRFPLKGLDEAIFGYLCMDSTELNFFDNPASIDIGYVVADLLCTLFMTRYVFTVYSEVYQFGLSALLSTRKTHGGIHE